MLSLLRNHLAAFRILLVLTAVTGIAYPLLITGVAQAAFPSQADGSLLHRDGRPVASSLLGQDFTLPGRSERPDPKWFQPRPSASGYDPLASGASNLGPNDPDLLKSLKSRRTAVAKFDGVDPASVPADALTASASGLDPDICPTYAYEQVARVARTRHLARDEVKALVADHVEGRPAGFLGEERVNVVELNLALSAMG